MFLFDKRKKRFDVQRLIRRVIDLSTPNRTPLEGEVRSEERYNRTLPVLLASFDNGEIDTECQTFALTSNLSGAGIAVTLGQPFRAKCVVVGFSTHERMQYVLGEVINNHPLGAGFWELSVKLTELITSDTHPQLNEFDHFSHFMQPHAKYQDLPTAHTILAGDA